VLFFKLIYKEAKMLFRRLTALSAATLVLMSSVNVLAAPVSSWSLSRDLMAIPGYPTVPTYLGNIVGPWTFLHGSVSSPLPVGAFVSYPPNYASWGGSVVGMVLPTVVIPLQSFTSSWNTNYTKGLTSVHPGPNRPVIVNWAGKTTGTVRVLARISDLDPNCGDGVKWVVYKNTAVLGTGVIANGNHGAIFDTAISVVLTDALNFVVEPNADYFCDSTALDVLITQTP
jgi:hypothetical protein